MLTNVACPFGSVKQRSRQALALVPATELVKAECGSAQDEELTLR